jgi:hypothetical protein
MGNYCLCACREQLDTRRYREQHFSKGEDADKALLPCDLMEP